MNLRDNVKVHTRQPAIQSCHTFASSINLDEDNDEMNSGETLERPIGKKAEKEKLKKRKNCDDVVPILSSQLDEIKEEKRRMHEKKKESMRIVLEEWRELMRIASCIKEEKNEVEKSGRWNYDERYKNHGSWAKRIYLYTSFGNLGEVKV